MEEKILCISKRKLTRIRLGTNTDSEEDYYNYLELTALYRAFQAAKCNSPCITVCIDDIIGLINELLYKIC